MTYEEKKSLYESIMKDVAKTVKKKINELSIGKVNNVFHKKYNGDFSVDTFGSEEKYDLYADQKGELTIHLEQPIFGMNVAEFCIRIGGYNNIEWNFDMKLSCDNIIKNSKYSPNSTLSIGVEMDRFGSIVNTKYMDGDYDEMNEEDFEKVLRVIKSRKSLGIFSTRDAKNISRRLRTEFNIDIAPSYFIYSRNPYEESIYESIMIK